MSSCQMPAGCWRPADLGDVGVRLLVVGARRILQQRARLNRLRGWSVLDPPGDQPGGEEGRSRAFNARIGPAVCLWSSSSAQTLLPYQQLSLTRSSTFVPPPADGLARFRALLEDGHLSSPDQAYQTPASITSLGIHPARDVHDAPGGGGLSSMMIDRGGARAVVPSLGKVRTHALRGWRYVPGRRRCARADSRWPARMAGRAAWSGEGIQVYVPPGRWRESSQRCLLPEDLCSIFLFHCLSVGRLHALWPANAARRRPWLARRWSAHRARASVLGAGLFFSSWC